MLPRSLFLALLATSCRSQYLMESGVRADITFNGNNDRYDVGNIIDEQKRAFNDLPSPMEEDRRRSFRPLAEMLKQERRRYQQAHDKSLRRMNSDFAYHDLMLEENEFVDGQYEKNLNPFKVQNNKSRRRGHVFFNSKNEPKHPNTGQKQKEPIKDLQDIVIKYLHGGKAIKPGRRMLDSNPEDEILLHYAVPLRLKVRGFLEMPRDHLV